jgi:two-component system, OmpR family, sensor histidine kinase CpxA
MKGRFYCPLLVKLLGCLALYLLVLVVAFAGFVGWQLGFGLDSLLSGSAGERLRDFGESVREEIQGLEPEEWDSAAAVLAAEKGVKAGFIKRRKHEQMAFEVPPNILERASRALPAARGPRVLRRPPRPRPEGAETEGAAPKLPPPRAIFLLRGDLGDGYWAGIQIFLQGPPGRPPREELLLIRGQNLSGSGMFFDYKPWLWGGLAVLLLSLVFWTPLILRVVREIRRLTAVTNRIAGGEFQISIPSQRQDELGDLTCSIQTMAVRLDQLVAGQKRFLRDAAHELCAPLARLRTGLGILELKCPTDSRAVLKGIEAEAAELGKLIEDVLAFSKAGSREVRIESLDLNALFEEVAGKEGGNLHFKIQVLPGLKVKADRNLLVKIFGNLIRNCRCHAGENAEVKIEAIEADDWVEIKISDNGPGVASEELLHLFEPFYRPDQSRSRQTGGSGLGLSIIDTAIKSCGGLVSISSKPGAGFTILIQLLGDQQEI